MEAMAVIATGGADRLPGDVTHVDAQLSAGSQA
jgi:hypothetical protein